MRTHLDMNKEFLDYRAPRTDGGFIGRIARAVYAWAIMRDLKIKTLSNEWNYAHTKDIVDRELRAIEETVLAAHSYQKKESEIVADRLARRFDPGMILNEVANRALEAKKAARADVPQLSGTQLRALEFQKEYLKRVVDRA